MVRPSGDRSYEIVAGERRWRAAQRAGLHEVPVVVVELTEREALEVAIIENVQRADLNPLEEAQGYEALMAQFEYSQSDLARVIGKSRPHIANTLRLMKLPDGVKAYLADGRISAGAARALLAHDDPERLARQILEKGLTVRDVEALGKAKAALTRPAPPEKDPDTRALEKAPCRCAGARRLAPGEGRERRSAHPLHRSRPARPSLPQARRGIGRAPPASCGGRTGKRSGRIILKIGDGGEPPLPSRRPLQ